MADEDIEILDEVALCIAAAPTMRRETEAAPQLSVARHVWLSLALRSMGALTYIAVELGQQLTELA